MPSEASHLTDTTTADHGDPEITLGVLHAVDADSAVTQRRLAHDLGIALGLTNAYLKRCVRKGLVKVSQAPPNRYLYYLTPKGFAEKSRLTGEYLRHSLHFFRVARGQCDALLRHCDHQGWHRVALYGASELAEITTLAAADVPGDVRLVSIIDPVFSESRFAGLPVVPRLADAAAVDAVLLTDLHDAEASFKMLGQHFPAERLLTPGVLRIVRDPDTAAGE